MRNPHLFLMVGQLLPVIDQLLTCGRIYTRTTLLVLLQADGKADEGDDVGDQDGDVGLVDGVHLHQDLQQGHLLLFDVTLFACSLAVVVLHVYLESDNTIEQTNQDGVVEKNDIECGALSQ